MGERFKDRITEFAAEFDSKLVFDCDVGDDAQIEKLFAVLRRMRDEGHSIIIITHKLNEVMELSDRVAILRKGEYITTVDTAQTGDLAGTRSWQDVLEPYVAKRWQLRELTVNYRTPAEITRYANRVLHHINPEHSPPTSLRSNGIEPYAVMGSPLAAAVVGALGDWPGLTAVIAPDDECAPIIAALDTGRSAFFDHHDPATIEWMSGLVRNV